MKTDAEREETIEHSEECDRFEAQTVGTYESQINRSDEESLKKMRRAKRTTCLSELHTPTPVKMLHPMALSSISHLLLQALLFPYAHHGYSIAENAKTED